MSCSFARSEWPTHLKAFHEGCIVAEVVQLHGCPAPCTYSLRFMRLWTDQVFRAAWFVARNGSPGGSPSMQARRCSAASMHITNKLLYCIALHASSYCNLCIGVRNRTLPDEATRARRLRQLRSVHHLQFSASPTIVNNMLHSDSAWASAINEGSHIAMRGNRCTCGHRGSRRIGLLHINE
jgi:hypothetical protein